MTLPSRRVLLLTVGAVVLLGILGAGGWFWYADQQRRGVAAYAEAMTRVQVAAQASQAPVEAREATVRDLEAALQRYPSAATAPQAAFQLGHLRYAAQQYAAARGAYEVAVVKAGPGTIGTLARAGIGAAWEAERNYPKAAEAYQAALAPLTPKGFFYEELLIDLGRVQELAGKKADAVATYRRLLKEAPQTRRADEVRARLATLGAAP